MKTITKFITVFILALTSLNSYAQEDFTTYDNSYIGKTYKIQISSKEKDDFKLWIDAMSFDKLHDRGGIKVNAKDYQDFISAISEAKLKYEEWVKTAKENNVKELTKTMKIKTKVDGYFEYGDWNFQYNVPLDFTFMILDKNDELNYLLLIRTGELQSSSNQFMKVDGFALVFSSTAEIDKFVNAISIEKVNTFLNKPKAKDLFKD